MQKMLIATQNIGKQKEIFALLSELNLELVTPGQLGLSLKIEENGKNYKVNATKKAKAYSTASGLFTLADDSGLEVKALGGKPGVFSARYSQKPDATDKDRRSYLLHELKSMPKPWRAEFVCVVAIHTPVGKTYYAEGRCQGWIIAGERGDNGFGYDPIFMVENLDSTMAELSMEMKNKISHRAHAINSIKPALIKLIEDSTTGLKTENFPLE